MGEQKRRRRMMAYHEAAHGVIARRLGLACVGIFMVPIEGVTETPGAHTASAAYASGEGVQEQIRGFEFDAMVALAGPVANVRYSGQAISFQEGAESDFEVAHSAAGCIALLEAGRPLPKRGEEMVPSPAIHEAADARLKLLLTKVETLVADNWSPIDRVATVLIKRDHITAAELDQLIAASDA